MLKCCKAGLSLLSALLLLGALHGQAYAIAKYRQHPTQMTVANEAMEVFSIVNRERKAQGLSPLVLDKELMEAAAIRARELPRNYSHTRPDGTSCFTVLKYHNAYKGENIAAGYPNSRAAMDGWMHSPGHRANILNPKFTKIGIGYVYEPNSKYRHYWTQLFLSRDF